MVIDAWMQHPGQTWLDNEMFDSLRRWKPGPWSESAQPIEKTLEAMDAAGVERGMLCAWCGPQGEMVSNDSVAELCAAHPDRFVGVASVDIAHPMRALNELVPAGEVLDRAVAVADLTPEDCLQSYEFTKRACQAGALRDIAELSDPLDEELPDGMTHEQSRLAHRRYWEQLKGRPAPW